MTESLVFPVALEAPEEVQVAGRRWYCRPEFHVTTFNPEDLAAATGVGAQQLAEVAEPLHDELTTPRPIRFDGRVSKLVDRDGQTLVAFCDVDGLEAIYARLSALARPDEDRPRQRADNGCRGDDAGRAPARLGRSRVRPRRRGPRSTEKWRRVSGNSPRSMYFTHVRKTPISTPCSTLHATVHAWQPMHRVWSMTNAYWDTGP